MRLSTIVNKLLAEGSIERVAVNRYVLHTTTRVRGLQLEAFNGTERRQYTLTQIHSMFAEHLYGEEYAFRRPAVRPQAQAAAPQAPVQQQRQARRIHRDSYHGNGSGAGRDGLQSALRAIPASEDGVRRSFGLEWEIGNLTSEQETDLAYLLDEMPAHFTERDGSLGPNGVEIIFLPLSEEKIIEVWTKLQNFCRDHRVNMDGTGAHLTYGVSDSNVSQSDLQIRLSRISMAVKAASTQGAIKRVFGRDYTYYACLPERLQNMDHRLAWSASRGDSAYELRLCHWQGDINKIVEFMKATEFVFHRAFTAQDFVNIFRIMGSDCEGV